jgi:hypothetical protein
MGDGSQQNIIPPFSFYAKHARHRRLLMALGASHFSITCKSCRRTRIEVEKTSSKKQDNAFPK